MGDACTTSIPDPSGRLAGTAACAPSPSRSLSRWDLLLVVVPVLAGAVSVAASWRFPVPVGDAAWLVQRVADAASGNWPLVGMPSTIGGGELATHHPGPVEFYWLAGFWKVAGFRGIPIGTAAAAGVALGWIGWTTRQLTGGRVVTSMGAQLAVAVGLLTIGPETLADPWNPFVALPWAMLVLVALVRLGGGDPHAWLAIAVGATAAVQLHAGYLPSLVILAAVLALWCVRHPDRRPHGAQWWWPAGIAVVLWLPPLVDLIAGDRNPVLLGRSLDASGGPSAGPGPVLVAASRALSPLHQALDDAWIPSDVRAGEVLVVVAVFAAALGSWWIARADSWQRRWVATMLAAIVVWMLLATRAPLADDVLAHSYVRPLWPMGAALWFGMGAAWWSRRPARTPEWAWLAPAAVMVLWAVTLPGGYVGIDPAARVRGQEVLDALADERAPSDGLTVAASGPIGGTWLAPAITAELDRRGVASGVGTDEWWDAHVMTTRPSPHEGSDCVWYVGDTSPEGRVLVPGRVAGEDETERLVELRRILAERYPSLRASRIARLREQEPLGPGDSVQDLLDDGRFADLVLAGSLDGISLRDDEVADYVELARLGSLDVEVATVVADPSCG